MRLGLVLGEAFQGLRRNASMVVSVVLVTFISLTFVGAAILLQGQIGSMKEYWYDRAQVAINFCSALDQTGNCVQAAATEAEVQAVRDKLAEPAIAKFIQSTTYDSPEQVLATVQQQLANNPIVSLLTPENIGGILNVTLYDPSNADIVVEAVRAAPGVLSVDDQRKYLEPIFGMLNAASAAAIGVAALMLVAAVLLIATTIRLSAFSRRRELGIMRLVGASNRLIETPFVLEGVISALIGSVLASVALALIVEFWVKGELTTLLGGGELLPTLQDVLLVAPILIAIGVVLAALSASVAIKRYLRV
ncbi:MAG: permease-like cell division protein FtsX [Microbacterium sp.]|nr:permease-like cell division protein FtsX [Microbacterium sp.]